MGSDESWDEDNVAGDDPWGLQAGHGTHAVIIYAGQLMEGNNTIISEVLTCKLYVALVVRVCIHVSGHPTRGTKCTV